MTKTEFNGLLKRAGLTKKEFAEKVRLSYSAVTGWGSGKDRPIPSWVASWLENFIKAKTLDSVKDVICDETDAPAR